MIHVLVKDVNFKKEEVFVRKGKWDKTRTTVIFNDRTLLDDLQLYLEERKKKGIHKDHLFLTRAKE